MQSLARRITLVARFANAKVHDTALVNSTPQAYENQHDALKKNIWRVPDPSKKRSRETHLSNAEYLISKVPPIVVHDTVVRCTGGTQIGAGHPQVYIQLNTREGEPVTCKWCGLRYVYAHNQHSDQ